MNALLQSSGDYFAFRQFVEAIGQQLYREKFLVRKHTRPQAAGFVDPAEFRLA
jgi:hypothetical protein